MARDGNPRVVHKYVELVDDFAGGRDLVGVGQVQWEGCGTEPLRDGVEPIGRPTGQQQAVRCRKRCGDGGTYATAGAGD